MTTKTSTDCPLSRREALVGLAGAVALSTTGVARASAGSSGPTMQWTHGQTNIDAIEGHDGSFFVAANGTVQALDAVSGSIEWTADAGGSVPEGAFAVSPAAAAVVFANDSSEMAALAIADGTQLWRRSAGSRGVGTALASGIAYVCSESTLTAVDVSTGERRWTHDVTANAEAAQGVAAMADDAAVETVAVYHTANEVVGVGPEGGRTWSVSPGTAGLEDETFNFSRDNSLVAQGKYVYFQGSGGLHGVVDAGAGQLVWKRADDYADDADKGGRPEAFDGGVVNGGADPTVHSLPGGTKRWATGIRSFDCLVGTEKALYVGGPSDGVTTLRSFGPSGTINWTLEFGEHYDYSRERPFSWVSPAVTDGTIAFAVDPMEGDLAIRGYELPEAEWVGRPQRETPTETDPAQTTTERTDAGAAGTGETPERSGSELSTATPTGDGDGGSTRGFFSNGPNRPLKSRSGSDLTAVSTLITVFGIGVTILDMVRGGEN